MAYVVRLQDFEGPLDLLLHLIGRAKVRIEEIFVSQITEQYLASMEDLSGLDMDTASEFLQMAATLMEIKSRALLPKPPKDEEEDPKEVLLRRLEEYRRIKEAGKALRAHEEEAGDTVWRLPMEMVTETKVELGSMSLKALQQAFLNVLLRAERAEQAPGATARRIQREPFTIRECMLRVLGRVLLYGQVRFYDLFPTDATRSEIVTTFLALLELNRANRIVLMQEGIYAPIVIREGKGEGADGGYAGGEDIGA